MFNIHNPLGSTFSDVVVPSVNVLGPLMIHRVLDQLLSRFIVNVELELLSFSAT